MCVCLFVKKIDQQQWQQLRKRPEGLFGGLLNIFEHETARNVTGRESPKRFPELVGSCQRVKAFSSVQFKGRVGERQQQQQQQQQCQLKMSFEVCWSAGSV